MGYLETWRNEIKLNSAVFAPLAKADPTIHQIFGVVGTMALWAIREKRPEQLAALAVVCPDEAQRMLLVEALEGWKKREPLEALQELDREQRKNSALQDAIKTLLAYFLEDLFSEQILKAPSIEINAPINAGNIVIGGQQVVLGDLLIQYIYPKAERHCPKPNEAPEHFGGRDAELGEVMALLKAGKDCAITALNGAGGMGKTTLARVLASRLYKDKTFRSVLWADVTRNPDFKRLLRGWAAYADSAFDPENLSDEAAALQVKSLLDELINEQCEVCEPSRVLVVLDDVWDNGITVARNLMRAKPKGATVLITTRSENLAHNLKATLPAPLSRMDETQAAALLREYLPQASLAILERLGKALNGHPLAMELAARRVKKENEGNFEATLERCIRDYEQGVPANTPFATLKLVHGEEKDDNLTTSLYHSYESLSEAAQERFRALGILAYDAPFDRVILKALWGCEDDSQTKDYCDELRLLSLIEVDGEREGWYRQHPLLRSYAYGLMNEIGTAEVEVVFRRYAVMVTGIAELFRFLPLEEWSQVEVYADHIHTVGDRLVEKQADYGKLAGDFSGNTMWYLNNRPSHLFIEKDGKREPQRIAWMKMGLQWWREIGDVEREATTLHNIGGIWDDLGDKHKALHYYEQALPLRKQVGDKGGEASSLNNIGGVWDALGDPHQALDFYHQALPITKQVGDKRGEATTLNNIGLVWSDLGEKQKALHYYEQALPLRKQVGDKGGEAATLNNIGLVWSDLGDRQKALHYYEQALPLIKQVGNKRGEAATLTNIGGVWSNLGDKQKALHYYEQALPLQQQVGDKRGEATTLTNIGAVWSALGDKHKALDYLEQALSLRKQVGDKRGEAATLNNIGLVWNDLGNKHKALHYYEQALPLQQQVGDKRSEAATLNNIGLVWDDLGDKQKALHYYELALPLQQQVGDKRGEATTLTNIGGIWDDLGDKQKALHYYEQALPLFRQVGNKRGEASTLNNIGGIWDDLGEKQKALHYYELALPLTKQVGDRRGEAITCLNIAMIYRHEGNLDEAIRYLERCVPIGHPNLESSRQVLENLREMRQRNIRVYLQELDMFVKNTVAVLTFAQDKRAGLLEALENIRQMLATRGENWRPEVEFADALMAILNGQPPTLPDDSPYQPYVQQVLKGISGDE